MTARSQSDEFGKPLYDTGSSDRAVVDQVARVAEQRGISRAQVALVWLYAKKS